MDDIDTLQTKAAYGIVDVIGNTPMIEIPTRCENKNVRIFGKLEGNNPGSSVKDRAAASMIGRAEQRGELKPGMTLIEPTSGNTGIALAMIAAAKGYKIELVMPENSTAERVQTMRAFGATVILTPADKSMEGAIDHARILARQNNYFMLDQFSNRDNPQAHYETTGPEIWHDTDEKITHFVSAMGTTGTIMGVSRFLKEQNPDVTIVGCQPTEGSRIPGIRRWPKEYLPKFFEPYGWIERLTLANPMRKSRFAGLHQRPGCFAGFQPRERHWPHKRLLRKLNQV